MAKKIENIKVYIIYYEWANTAGNHAGMAYLFRKMKEWNNKNIHLIKIPTKINQWLPKIQKIYSYGLYLYLIFISGKNKKIFFTEFLGNRSGNQTWIAHLLHKKRCRAQLYGLVHLSPQNLKELYNDEKYIKDALQTLNKVIVFGSSLAHYFSWLGFSEKVTTTFHYVDTSFYTPGASKPQQNNLQIISMGSLKRNYSLLEEIIQQTPDYSYHICMGNNKLEPIFSRYQNVKLYSFLDEVQLLKLMQNTDINLSVMEDTIGSNVITTSMACGLVQLVSDVGSIRDYCDVSNALFCSTATDFVNGLNYLRSNPELLNNMAISARKRSKELDIYNFNKEFCKLFLFN